MISQLETLFQYKAGYTISGVIATTFTYSTSILGELLLRIASFNEGNICKSATMVSKKYALKKEVDLETIQGKRKLFIFAHDFKGLEPVDECAKVGNQIQLRRYLKQVEENFVTRVSCPQGYFHPKIIIVILESRENPEHKIVRMMISSKNLTADNYFQSGTFFSTECEGEEVKTDVLKAFFTELNYKNDHCLKYLIDSIPCNIKANSEGNAFKLFIQKPGENIIFDALKKDYDICDTCEILTDSFNGDFFKQFAKKSKVILNLYKAQKFVSEYENYADKVFLPESAGNGKYKASYYNHAKVFVFYCKNKIIIWNGSANCTGAAFSNNYECIVRYEINKKPINPIMPPNTAWKAEYKDIQTSEDTKKDVIAILNEADIKCLGIDKNIFTISVGFKDLPMDDKCSICAELPMGGGSSETVNLQNNVELKIKTKKGMAFIKPYGFVDENIACQNIIVSIRTPEEEYSVFKKIELKTDDCILNTMKKDMIDFSQGKFLYFDEKISWEDAIPMLNGEEIKASNPELKLAQYLARGGKACEIQNRLIEFKSSELVGLLDKYPELVSESMDLNDENLENDFYYEYKKSIEELSKLADIISKIC